MVEVKSHCAGTGTWLTLGILDPGAGKADPSPLGIRSQAMKSETDCCSGPRGGVILVLLLASPCSARVNDRVE